jgi:hypothetical protein
VFFVIYLVSETGLIKNSFSTLDVEKEKSGLRDIPHIPA